MKIRTEFKFVLPRGHVDKEGKYRKIQGVMRLIKVKDLIQVYHDSRVKENESYFYIVLLSRVITKFDAEKLVTSKTIERLCPEDFAFLVDFLNEINHRVIKMIPLQCSACKNRYIGEFSSLGEQ
ncbi:MAG: hypothetical protein JW881_16780 [Spirochaetales bacterium]|nr:hypothetical protein [Spirochaetales bacterium]